MYHNFVTFYKENENANSSQRNTFCAIRETCSILAHESQRNTAHTCSSQRTSQKGAQGTAYVTEQRKENTFYKTGRR